MRSVYEPSSAIQAHVLQDVLRQHGISSHVAGEHLQGAIGELPAGNLVRLLVSEEDWPAARRAVLEWESAPPMADDDLANADHSAPCAESPPATAPQFALTGNGPADGTRRQGSRFHPLWWAVGGAATALALQFVLTGVPLQSDTRDYNRDGVPDETVRMNAFGSPLVIEQDRNFDGKVDARSHFNSRGDLQRTEYDENFDGQMDMELRYVNGVPAEARTDTDGDGFPDLITVYEYGVPVRSSYIHRNTGKPARVEHYRMGKITSVQLDRNADGVLDTEQTFDTNGMVTAERTINSAAK